MGAKICPRCGAENEPLATNCQSCRINLQFAFDNPEELERLAQESPLSAQPAGTTKSQPNSWGKPILHLLGSFAFAFLLGEVVHELGHFLAHRAFGVQVGIRLDPFGGSRILLGDLAPQEYLGITTLAGPLFNLLTGSTVTLTMWKFRQPMFLPLLLWGPVAWIQEGVTFSLGMLTSGGDADLLVRWGIPSLALIGFGVLLLAAGVFGLARLLPLAGVSAQDSKSRLFAIVSGGMMSFMLVRLFGSIFTDTENASENVLPLVFALILAVMVVVVIKPVHGRVGEPDVDSPTDWTPVVISTVLGAAMIAFQLAAFN